jgi:hypothetical protein
MRNHYLLDATYRTLLEALTRVQPDPVTGELEPHTFALILGEVGGIWSDNVLDDPEHDLEDDF